MACFYFHKYHCTLQLEDESPPQNLIEGISPALYMKASMTFPEVDINVENADTHQNLLTTHLFLRHINRLKFKQVLRNEVYSGTHEELLVRGN